jgi:phage terminase large subunit-like protein
VIDYDFIRAKLNELASEYQIKKVAIDRWNAAQLSTQLSGDGFEMVGFGQGFASMSSPTKELEKLLVIARQINQRNNPVLRWMESNVANEQDAAGNVKPSKKKSTERIDGIVAAIMAIGRMGFDAEESQFHDYEFAFA